MDLQIESKKIIKEAHNRIKGHIHNTPLIYSETLNNMLDTKIYFKMDAMQKTGSFKLRGVLNHLINLKNQNTLPKKLVAYSTGNHALAMSYAAKIFNIHARVYLPQNVSPIKKRIASYYGSEVIEVPTRIAAEELAKHDGDNGFHYLHPSDNEHIIAGAGTLCYEAILNMQKKGYGLPDAVFASCGGGGLLAGTFLAKEELSPLTQVIGAEPEIADDAHRSIESGSLFRFTDSPETIADGLRTLGLSKRTFDYLKRINKIYLCSEDEIFYWTAWLMQAIKVTCEPSAAISMAAAFKWIKENGANKKILVLISGGNIDPTLYEKLWSIDHLKKLPSSL